MYKKATHGTIGAVVSVLARIRGREEPQSRADYTGVTKGGQLGRDPELG